MKYIITTKIITRTFVNDAEVVLYRWLCNIRSAIQGKMLYYNKNNNRGSG